MPGRFVILAAVAVLLTACAGTPSGLAQRTLVDGLREQYHACVPLGWNPVPVARYYVPGESVEYRPAGVWLRPYWLGLIATAQLHDRKARVIKHVLDRLVLARMLMRSRAGASTYYRLMPKALRYYFDDNVHGDNPDHLPYLCYSRIVPQHVVSSPLSHERGVLLASFGWRSTAPAAWAADPFLQSHSVVLPPLSQRATATLVSDHGYWYVKRISSALPMLPRPVSPSAWPKR